MAKIAARTAGTTGTKCCCDPAIITECRKRSGTAMIAGWSELIGYNSTDIKLNPGDAVDFKSTPPKKYLRRSFSGSTEALVQFSGFQFRYGHELSGYDQYSPINQTGVSYGTDTRTSGNPASPPPQVNLAYSNANIGSRSPIEPLSTLNNTIINIAKLSAFVTTSASAMTAGLVCSDVSASGTLSMVLDMEDTELAAESRATGNWGYWSLRGAVDCGTCCIASRQLRTTGFAFTFQSSQFRFGIEEGPVDRLYIVAVDYVRREIGDTEWIKVATDYFSVVSTEPAASHDGWTAYPVPQLAGYETTIDNIRIYHPDE